MSPDISSRECVRWSGENGLATLVMVARRGVHDHAVQEHTPYNRIDFFPMPTIAAIEGHCLGAGWRWPWPATCASPVKPRGWACPR
jgi:hypothetical protein